MLYAGIGSRQTPYEVLLEMRVLGNNFALLGDTLRSGGARGADTAFEQGHRIATSQRIEIYRADDATREAIEMASEYHPAWDRCSSYARHLHGRNCMIMLGRNLDTPVEAVYYWTPGGNFVGGTGQALRMARALNIPTYLVTPGMAARLFDQ